MVQDVGQDVVREMVTPYSAVFRYAIFQCYLCLAVEVGELEKITADIAHTGFK